MEDIKTRDFKIQFSSIDYLTGEGTDYLTLEIENKVTKEDVAVWLEKDEVKQLIKQLTDWLDD